MKTNSATTFLMAGLLAGLTACGGGSGSGSSGSTKQLNFGTSDLSESRSVAVATGSVGDEAVVARANEKGEISTFRVEPSSGTRALVYEDVDGILKKVFPVDLDIKSYGVPNSIREGNQYIAAAGDFVVETAEGEQISCQLLLSKLEYDANAECLHTSDSSQEKEVHVAVIRDKGRLDSTTIESKDNDAVYYSVNTRGGGFTIFRYYEGEVSEAASSDEGRITKILAGTNSIFAYDQEGVGRQYVYGNDYYNFTTFTADEQRNIIGSIHPILHSQWLIYPLARPFAGDDQLPDQSFIHKMDDGVSIGAGSPSECGGPASSRQLSKYSTGTYWIGADNGKLCNLTSYFEEENDFETYIFRTADSELSWREIRIVNDVIVGIVDRDGGTGLVIDAADTVPLENNNQQTSIESSDKLYVADLEEVTSLAEYVNGVVVIGTKGGEPAVRYCNTTSGYCDFSIDSGSQEVLEDRMVF